jgi:23S rRNA (cytidine1920-2'-O)/16S rRNA (cytidine1409-2'-O)-methyltransferase
MRADVYLFNSGNVKSRQNAKILIESGNVIIDGKKITKPAFEIDECAEHKVEITNKSKFVSRGGEKLDFALEKFNIDVTGMTCIDIGASTGGFTDCLLQRNAGLVYAVDSGHSQLDSALENNERVVSIEKFNAKFMSKKDFEVEFDIAVMDVSFISQTLIHSAVHDVLKDGGIFISLIKPQFECGKSALNSHGIVKKATYHKDAICKVIDSALISGFSCENIICSPIEGGSGNVEFLVYLRKSTNPKSLVNEAKIKLITHSK